MNDLSDGRIDPTFSFLNTVIDSIFSTTWVMKRSIHVLLDVEKFIGGFATFEREKFCNICLNAYQLIYQN